MIPILKHTHTSFADEIFRLLGKGRVHAELVYEEFFRNGKVEGKNPAFLNAQALLRNILELTDFSSSELVEERNDGVTRKFLIRTKDLLEIESVLIPMQSGGTLCISSQVGCRMGCAFCETGRMGLIRNLSVEEIVSQVFIARHVLNYDTVMQAVRVLSDSRGFGFGRTHITISTSGVLSGIEKLSEEGEIAPNLAVSINAPQNSIRTRLMPVNRKANMELLYQAMHQYCTKTGRQILAAYVLLQGQNDTLEHADQLASYLKGLHVKINLIPYNPQSNDRFQPPEDGVIEAFAKRLRELGFYTLLRLTKGRRIMAGCGQLGNVNLRKSKALVVNHQ
jgi:23S rRNA (adenine2503-C2)-methyltransferase